MHLFDYSNLKNIHWDNEILNYVALIHEYKGQQSVYIKNQPTELERLIEIAKIQSTESSNDIEGIRTTNTRLKQLCNDKTTPKTRDEKEIMGYRDVLNTIHENYLYIPIQSSYILQLHRDLFRYSEKSIGGKYKNTQNYISATDTTGTTYTLFTPVAPHETPSAIDKICNNFNQCIDNGEIDPLILIPIFIHDFLCIHPFNDGNGRMSRLLTILLLYRCDYIVGRYISLESKIAKTKNSYYDALENSQIGWYDNTDDPTPFIKYLLGTMLAAYRDLNDRISLVTAKSSALDMVKSIVTTKIGKFTKNNILDVCPSIKKATVEKALKTLVEEGILEKHGVGRSTFYTRK